MFKKGKNKIINKTKINFLKRLRTLRYLDLRRDMIISHKLFRAPSSSYICRMFKPAHLSKFTTSINTVSISSKGEFQHGEHNAPKDF